MYAPTKIASSLDSQIVHQAGTADPGCQVRMGFSGFGRCCESGFSCNAVLSTQVVHQAVMADPAKLQTLSGR